MTPLMMLLLFNAGTLMGFFLHSFLQGAHRDDPEMQPVFVQAPPSFRDDLLLPVLPEKNRYLH
jgi:hypothetical protein